MSSSLDKVVEAIVAFDLFPSEERARALIQAITEHVAGELVRKAVEEALA